ncbi:MAG: hypothetical protein NXI04_17705 [Planctomycetaceae bacterium]|nr:hypothetical protein [Planctomycetaceae bacterium]
MKTDEDGVETEWRRSGDVRQKKRASGRVGPWTTAKVGDRDAADGNTAWTAMIPNVNVGLNTSESIVAWS